MKKAGLYLNGEYLGKPKRLPDDLLSPDKSYGIVGRVTKGWRWFRPWRVNRWMTDRELARHRRSFAPPSTKE